MRKRAMTKNSSDGRAMVLLVATLASGAAQAASHDMLRYFGMNSVGVSTSTQDSARRLAARLNVIPVVGNGAPGGELAATVWRQSELMTIRVNAAAGLSGERQPVWFGAVILEGPNGWVLRPVSEMFLEHDVNGATELSALLGTICRVRKNLSADAGLRASRVSQSGFSWSATEVRAGVSWRF